MRFYRPLRPLAALTFDLDDTLYDNRPVIQRTEQETLAFLQGYHPGLLEMQSADWQRLRAELYQQEPEISHDVSRWRWRAIHLALSRLGLPEAQATSGADAAMERFAYWRSRIQVPQETFDTLQALAQRYPLAAITNGNVRPEACGLGVYFQFVLYAGPDGRAKPDPHLFRLAAQRLGVACEQVLHVGDDLTADVVGALRSGMQACWINDREQNLRTASDSRLLPHLEISRLASLSALL